MNNLDTNKVKGIVGENFISSKQQKISLYKDGKTVQKKWDGIKVTIYGSKVIIQKLKPWTWKMCKDLKFIIQYHLRI